jgi:hypothetical protein
VITPTLADIYFQQGQIQLSLQIYDRLLEREPDNNKIAKRITEIRSMLERGEIPEQKPVAGIRQEKVRSERERSAGESPTQKSRKKKKSASAEVSDSRPLAGVRIKKRYKQAMKNARKSKK